MTSVDPLLANLIVRNAGEVVTPEGPAPRRGAAQNRLRRIPGGAVASRDGRIVFVGATPECDARVTAGAGALVIDAAGRVVLPGFVDPHTHLVYAGDRRDELCRRLAGASYADIAAGGGGIVSTVKATRAASDEQLVAASRARLDGMLRAGTTTCEAKSGYGLETATELRILRAIRTLTASHPIDIVSTFMGAHDVPLEWRGNRRGYLDLVLREMLPAVAGAGLAEWCDVFCEEGVFSEEETVEILAAARAHGLKGRVHADELGSSGGSMAAARAGARSADHLVHVNEAGIAALARAGVVATLLPAAAFFLKLGRYAPARALIDAGVPVALATDLNPGGGFSPSMPFVIALACFAMNMTLEEALVGATLNAAHALDRDEHAGSLEPGKRADLVLLRGTLVDLLHVGAAHVDMVIKDGKVVVSAC